MKTTNVLTSHSLISVIYGNNYVRMTAIPNVYIPTDCAICDSCPRDDLCFLLRPVRLSAFTRKETRTSSSPRGLFFSFVGLLFNSYHLKQISQCTSL
jgi:hypothetical protein